MDFSSDMLIKRKWKQITPVFFCKITLRRISKELNLLTVNTTSARAAWRNVNNVIFHTVSHDAAFKTLTGTGWVVVAAVGGEGGEVMLEIVEFSSLCMYLNIHAPWERENKNKKLNFLKEINCFFYFLFPIPSQLGSVLKGQNSLLYEQSVFLISTYIFPFRRDTLCRKAIMRSIKLFSFVKVDFWRGYTHTL